MAILKRDKDIFVTENDNVISAFLNNGFEVVEDTPQLKPATKKATKKEDK